VDAHLPSIKAVFSLLMAGGTNAQYKSKARALLFNLRDSNNPQLRGRVLAGDIKPGALVQMTSEELASKVPAAALWPVTTSSSSFIKSNPSASMQWPPALCAGPR
jgi:Transcription factor S-II (TFIIS), central domain